MGILFHLLGPSLSFCGFIRQPVYHPVNFAYKQGDRFVDWLVGRLISCYQPPTPNAQRNMFDSLHQFPTDRRWREQPFPAPIVVALIRRQQADAEPRYLLIRRKAGPYSGQWALVGGKWDFGETLATAVTREVQEETGLVAKFIALRGIVSERVLPPNDDLPGAHFLLLVCELTAPDGVASEQAEGAVAWFTPTAISELHSQQAIIPSDYAMIQQFLHSFSEVTLIEAEMISAIGGSDLYPTELRRFERTAPPAE
jgi:8-oxo-dGTP diphosphatase